MKIKLLTLHNRGLIAIWIIVQSFIFFYLGVHTDLEAAKYTYQANNILTTGEYSAPKYLFYSILIYIIALFTKLGLSYHFVAFLQILINGTATVILYKFSEKITGRKQIAYIATLLFIIFYPLQMWNVYLYTESLFISFTIFFVFAVIQFPPKTPGNLLINLPFLILLILTRPFGLLFILPFLVYAIIISTGFFRKLLLGISLLGFITMLILINYAFNGGEDMDALKPFKEEHVICFLQSPDPEPLKLVQTANPVYDIFYYLAHNPIHFLKLMIKRIISFFYLPRPYYSSLHNIILILFIIPIYIFALIALVKGRKHLNPSATLFILLTIAFYTLGTTLQCDDYHSRFIMPLFAFIFIVSASGIVCISDIILKNQKVT